MNSKIYRCGHCGAPTDSEGNSYEFDSCEFKKAVRILDEYGDSHTECLHGDCCIHEAQEEENWVQVSREMAMDAGYPDMEGTWIKW